MGRFCPALESSEATTTRKRRRVKRKETEDGAPLLTLEIASAIRDTPGAMECVRR
jgi:hypothetical protein